VDEAGKTMDEIVAAVKRVTDSWRRIAAASRSRARAIEQVNQAITQMDEVTQQTGAGGRGGGCGGVMEERAQGLAQAVAVFKLAAAGRTRGGERREARASVTQLPRKKALAKGPATVGEKTGCAQVANAKQGRREWEEF